VPVSWIGTSSCRGGPWLFSCGGTTIICLDQQLSHPLKCLVIFDLLGKSGVSTCSAASLCSGLAQRVSDACVHAARLPYLRLILPPRARP
jgi:hypothetical protein